MHQFKSITGPALLACLVLLAAQSRAEDGPKEAAVKFAKALQAGDTKATHDACIGTQEQFKTLDSMTDMLSTMVKFKAICDKKYGADNSLSKQFGGGGDLAVEAGKADYVIEGDTATAVDKAKPDEKNKMKLKKIDGQWKIDLASMGDDAAPPAEALTVVKVLKETGDEVEAGKHKTAQDATLAIGLKMQGLQK